MKTTTASLKISLMLMLFLVFSRNIFAQNDIVWKKHFGGRDYDEYYSVAALSEGVVAVGYSESGSFGYGDWTGFPRNGGADAIVVKYDDNGSVVWKKHFGGSSDDVYYSVTAVPDGVIAVGYSEEESFGTWDWAIATGRGAKDAIIVKYDHNGNVLWKKNFGGNSIDIYRSVTAVSDGIIAAGYASVENSGDWAGITGKGNYDAIIVKYDHNGNILWKKNFGGSSHDEYYSVTAVPDGIIAVGYSRASSFGSGDWTGVAAKGIYYNAIIVKYDHDGKVKWKKNFGGSSTDVYCSVTAVSDGVIAAGHSWNDSFGVGDWKGITGKGDLDAIIVKYDHNGNVLWKKNFGGSAGDYYRFITAVSDGIIATGYSQSGSFGTGDWKSIKGKGSDDAIIVKYDHNGDVLWKRNFGGSSGDNHLSATEVSDGIVAVGGSTSFNSGDWTGITGNGGNADAIIVKYNLNPNPDDSNPDNPNPDDPDNPDNPDPDNPDLVSIADDVIPQAKTLKASVQNDILYISGLTSGKTWRIYNMLGILVYEGIATGDAETWRAVSLQNRGMYIIQSNNKAIKVVY